MPARRRTLKKIIPSLLGEKNRGKKDSREVKNHLRFSVRRGRGRKEGSVP